jgi:uncharacterized protein (DUF58 family)
MIPAEIIRKVRLIEIKTRHIVNNLFGGEYHSAFKGMGMEFAEVREYAPGDDIRAIDWNVTARAGKPFIKKFNEERELTVMMMVDVSASGFFGTGNSLKSDIMIELASILSFSAIKNNDKVGLLLFSDQVEKFIPPKKGKSHVLRVIREMIFHPAKDNNTNISVALEHIHKVIKRKSIIFLISDFWDKSFHRSMKLINNKHDLINIHILDKAEETIPDLGFIKIHDVESQETAWVETNKSKIQDIISRKTQSINKSFYNFCKLNRIDIISINTGKDYIKPLEEFFNNRIKRY